MKDMWITPEDLERLYSGYHKFLVCEWKIPQVISPSEQESYEVVATKIFLRIYKLAKPIEEFLGHEIIVAIVSVLREQYRNIIATTGSGKKRVLATFNQVIPGNVEKYYILIPMEEYTTNQWREVKRMVKMIQDSVERIVSDFQEKRKRYKV